MVRSMTVGRQHGNLSNSFWSASAAAGRPAPGDLKRYAPLLLICCFSQFCCLSAAKVHGENWPRFRGPNGTGASDLQGVPTQWSEEDYEWTTQLPGIGHSSPVIWDDALFLTSGNDRNTDPESAVGSRSLHRVNAITGDLEWSREFELSSDVLHTKNSYASCTPTLDGERVYLAMATDDEYLLVALTMEGEELWTAALGPFESQHGQGVSPIVYKDMVILANDQMGPSSIMAFDRESGDEVWTTPRNQRKTSYATPCIMPVEGYGPQILCLSGASGLAGLDPETGRQLWATGELPHRTVASPTFGDGVVIATCGGGGIGKYMIAMEAPGSGAQQDPEIRYEREQSEGLPYVPTPIIHDNHVYLWCDQAMVCCVEIDTGETVWRKRVEGNYSGSPVMIDGKLYCISEGGEIAVLDASPEFHLYGSSPLGDGSHATPAVANGRVYFRGFGRLACLASASVNSEGRSDQGPGSE